MADVLVSPHTTIAPHLPHDDTPSVNVGLTPPSAAGSHHGPSANSSRRPPRKSTLTQQQKNQKRQRATQDQLMTLEVEFNKNPTPSAVVRERIASDINMTERSVQIWFQNRRAKIKNIAKRSIESGEDCDAIPDSMRQYLAMQHYGGGKPTAAGALGRAGSTSHFFGGALAAGSGSDASAVGKVVIQHFACRSLSIGSWRRVGQSTMDLVVFYSPDKACVTYYIHNDSAGYKIEYPFAWIKNITLEHGDVMTQAEGASQGQGGLMIELTRPPRFYMDGSGSGGFYECGDFTEDQQATQVMVHQLGGPSKVLCGQLAKLVSLDSYQNRHNALFEPISFPAASPISPVGHRPQSQPNHVMHPHLTPHLATPDNAPGNMGPPGPRGHKRQRSRSVPVAVDFSMLRRPTPSFLVQHNYPPAPPPAQDPAIFSPIPQHQQGNAFVQSPALADVDDGSGFPSFSMGCPVSTASNHSSTDFGSPAFFPPGTTAETPQWPSATMGGYVTSEPSSMLGNGAPLSLMGASADPVIANHSPPLNGLGRQGCDMFGGDATQFAEDGLFLSETFHKQIALPFRSPISEQPFHSPMPDGAFNFNSPPSVADAHAPVAFQSPQLSVDDPKAAYHSPDLQPHNAVHQDSVVSFSTPSQMSDSATRLSHSPKGTTHASFSSASASASMVTSAVAPVLSSEVACQVESAGHDESASNFANGTPSTNDEFDLFANFESSGFDQAHRSTPPQQLSAVAS